jgi:cyclopropane fatty-acyl-phospholipid synthase-like methyltransferase
VQYVYENLAHLLKITEADVVFEIGSNDGKVLISCCKQANCRGVGIEVSESAVWKARDAAVRCESLAKLLKQLHRGTKPIESVPTTVPMGNLLL